MNEKKNTNQKSKKSNINSKNKKSTAKNYTTDSKINKTDRPNKKYNSKSKVTAIIME